MRQGEQGQQIRDIISESEGERKGVRKQQGFEQNIKVDEEEDMENHEELVEEEIVGECDLVPLGMEGNCSDEPPDKIISSPISKRARSSKWGWNMLRYFTSVMQLWIKLIMSKVVLLNGAGDGEENMILTKLNCDYSRKTIQVH